MLRHSKLILVVAAFLALVCAPRYLTPGIIDEPDRAASPAASVSPASLPIRGLDAQDATPCRLPGLDDDGNDDDLDVDDNSGLGSSPYAGSLFACHQRQPRLVASENALVLSRTALHKPRFFVSCYLRC